MLRYGYIFIFYFYLKQSRKNYGLLFWWSPHGHPFAQKVLYFPCTIYDLQLLNLTKLFQYMSQEIYGIYIYKLIIDLVN